MRSAARGRDAFVRAVLRARHADQWRLRSGFRVAPGNRLEKLSGDRAGQHSIRIDDQWRLCFVWADGAAHEVEITDYH